MRKGIYLALLTALISGFSVFANKIFVTTADPLAFTTLRNLLVGIFFCAILITTGKAKQLRRLTRRQWLALGVIGGLGGGIAFALFFSGLAEVGAVEGNLLHKTLFIWVALLALPILRERLTRLQLLGYGFFMLAVFVLGGPATIVLNRGAFMVLAATLLWAGENLLAKKILPQVSPDIISWARMILGFPVLIVLTLVLGKGQLLFSPQTFTLLPLVTSSLFLTAYMFTWYRALRVLPVTVATAVLAVAPMVTTLLSAGFITHILPQQQVSVAVIMGIGLVCIILPRIRRPAFVHGL